MKYCKRCVMPDTRPGLTIDEEGVCSACRHYEQRQNVDWKNRRKELEELCDRYRGSRGDDYDCILPMSGGKDSHFAAYVIKEKLNMNPLLVCVGNPFGMTKAGEHNLNNLSDVFGCDSLVLMQNRQVAKKLIRKAFETLGSPTWYYDQAIYTFPLQVGIKYDIPFIIWGEDTSYVYGGPLKVETPSALKQIDNDAVKDVGGLGYWLGEGITMKDLRSVVYPSKEKIEQAKLNPVFLSYFCEWSGYSNYELAKAYGFRSLDGEWDRRGYVESYDQIDSVAYLCHIWLKYPKYGHCRATDVCSNWIREGRITREAAIELVKERDHELDPRALADFCDFTGYTEEEFWKIADKFYNRDLFEKDEKGEWKLKQPIWEEK